MKNYWIIVCALVPAVGCSADPSASRFTNSQGGTAVGSGGVTATASGGMPSIGSGGMRAGVGGMPSGSGGSGGASVASGGSASAQPSGGNQNTHTGGTPGTPASGGAAATGGAPSSSAGGGAQGGDLTPGRNYRLEVPCIKASDESPELCESVMSLPPTTLTFGGDPQSTYKVTLRFRGVTEGHTFSDSNNQKIATVTLVPYFLDSAQGHPNQDDHALFSIDVAQPQKIYYANAFSTVDGAADHRVYPLDYMADITVQGGASVTLKFADGNNIQTQNLDFANDAGPFVVDGVPPAAGFDGEFLQIDVVSVTQQ